MSIIQFLRIFWANRILILAAGVACFVGALIVCSVVPPVWTATTRVMVDVGKPDPVTGEVRAGNSRSYLPTQPELVTDYTVAGKVVDDLNLLSDPGLIRRYQSRPKSDKRDFRRYAEQIIVDNTKAKQVGDSNIIEITYKSDTPEGAKAFADAVRTAYIETSLSFQRETAERNADWFTDQSVKAKAALDEAINAETEYERANGLVMTNDKVDVESARLQAMAGQGAAAPPVPPVMQGTSSAGMQLAEVDAQIAIQSKDLGPNNPVLQQLKAQRASLAEVVVKEAAANRQLANATASTPAAIAGQVAAQKAKVVAQSDKIGKLSQLQAEVDLRRDIFNKTTARAAELRQQALAVEVGLTPLATAAVPTSPSFPNKLLILPGSLVLGFGVGALIALLLELFARRVRGVEDLASSIDTPLLGVIAAPPLPPGTGLGASILARFRLPDLRRAAST